MAVQPTGEEVEVAQVVAPPPVEVAEVTAPAAVLPATSSTLPLIALLGLLALGGAFVLRSAQKRVQ
jgi:LPXTG-motif cell wall-anchored protein